MNSDLELLVSVVLQATPPSVTLRAMTMSISSQSTTPWIWAFFLDPDTHLQVLELVFS